MNEPLIAEIKSKGYWRVSVRPAQFNKKRLESITECRSVLREAQVRLRGWYFPHFKEQDIAAGNGWIECGTSWHVIREYWRFYQSGQLIHLNGCMEDYQDQGKLAGTAKWVTDIRGDEGYRFLDVLTVIYFITEIYEFASRLARLNVLGDGAVINIDLHGAYNRVLFFYDPGRTLSMPYVSKLETIEYQRALAASELLTSAREAALAAIKGFFERFNWEIMPIQLFQDEQEKLLKGKT